MRYFLLLTLFITLISRTITRPSRSDQRAAEEVEYGNNEDPREISVQEEEETSLNDQDLREDEPSQDEEQIRQEEASNDEDQNNLNEEKYMTRVAADESSDKPINERLMEFSQKNKEEKINEEASNNNALPNRRQSYIKYIENSEPGDGPENTQHPANKQNRMQNDVRDNELDKRTIDSRRIPSDESEVLFDKQRIHRNNPDKSEYHSENAISSEKNYRLKQYYNTMQSDHKNLLRERDRNSEIAQFMLNRDRRQVESTDALGLTSTSTEKESIISDTVNDDDEAAIKRHIKKLSGEELEELLNSLSDEKKALLNKIIDSDHNYDSLNKREITKKAGADEENNYMDIGISELNKLQAVSSAIDGITESANIQSSDTETTKQEGQTECSEMSDVKVPETTKTEVSESKAELVGSRDGATNNVNMNANRDPKNAISPNSQLAKLDSKREVNTDYLRNQDEMLEDSQYADNYLNIRNSEEPFDEQSHSCVSQEEDLSQLIDDETQLHQNQEFKREAIEDNQEELDESMRSLEDSFPKSDCEESGQYDESNLAPLIRVKRKDKHEIQKRAAALLPDTKVAFVPYKAENDDEDNDEGNEFDDEGFYDRTANFAKNNVNKPDDNLAPTNFAFDHLVKKPSSIYVSDKEIVKLSESSPDNKLNSDSRSLGSDTDSVLSGVEGVDDNLMYNSGTRNRRTIQEDLEQPIDSNRILRSTPLAEEAVKSSENRINIPNYQENDAFGALPRSYEGDLARYKRIRRVRPSSEVSDFEKK